MEVRPICTGHRLSKLTCHVWLRRSRCSFIILNKNVTRMFRRVNRKKFADGQISSSCLFSSYGVHRLLLLLVSLHAFFEQLCSEGCVFPAIDDCFFVFEIFIHPEKMFNLF